MADAIEAGDYETAISVLQESKKLDSENKEQIKKYSERLIDTTVFTRQELSAVFTGLKTLDSVSTSQSADKLASKMGAKDVLDLTGNMTIDLASFYKTSFSAKIEMIKQAISERRCIWLLQRTSGFSIVQIKKTVGFAN